MTCDEGNLRRSDRKKIKVDDFHSLKGKRINSVSLLNFIRPSSVSNLLLIINNKLHDNVQRFGGPLF